MTSSLVDAPESERDMRDDDDDDGDFGFDALVDEDVDRARATVMDANANDDDDANDYPAFPDDDDDDDDDDEEAGRTMGTDANEDANDDVAFPDDEKENEEKENEEKENETTGTRGGGDGKTAEKKKKKGGGAVMNAEEVMRMASEMMAAASRERGGMGMNAVGTSRRYASRARDAPAATNAADIDGDHVAMTLGDGRRVYLKREPLDEPIARDEDVYARGEEESWLARPIEDLLDEYEKRRYAEAVEAAKAVEEGGGTRRRRRWHKEAGDRASDGGRAESGSIA